MKIQPVRSHWLTALLLVGLAAQTAVAATHSSLADHAGTAHEQSTDGDDHDPASCFFCRVAPAAEHALTAPPLVLPVGADGLRRATAPLLATPDEPAWARPASRAPPSPQSS